MLPLLLLLVALPFAECFPSASFDCLALPFPFLPSLPLQQDFFAMGGRLGPDGTGEATRAEHDDAKRG
ncbi:hypothetical protein ACFYVL_43665 [Streptomyces sp. NPDC004111]|uniref:hypothetical protein n=1 Tax=Streptomyces sp. NPDC004111 TaxID=3364690 RepID=UPI0036C22F15